MQCARKVVGKIRHLVNGRSLLLECGRVLQRGSFLPHLMCWKIVGLFHEYIL